MRPSTQLTSENSSTWSEVDSFIVLIPVFNPPESLLSNIGRIAEPDRDLLRHIVIIDDGSTNGMVETLKERFPEVGVLRGDGSLWWGGGMRLGMEHALEQGVEAVIWLNHDCTPDPGTLRGLAGLAAADGVGAVSAWCYCREDAEYGVNPGFRGFKEIPVFELIDGDLVEVDGVNGNCTAISTAAIRKVGLPEAQLHPHYGDGPYTWRLHQSGFHNFVAPKFRAALDREFERCIDEEDHSAFWQVPLSDKIQYYLFSNRSKYHWRNRFHDIRAFRGKIAGTLAYVPAQAKILLKVARGHLRRGQPFEPRLDEIVTRYNHRLPAEALKRDLLKLHQRHSR